MYKLLLVTLSFFFTLALTAQSNIPAGTVVINEFVADNDSIGGGISDPDGGYPDWIELYNNSDVAIDLSNTYLSDKEDNPLKFQFPEGTVIDGAGYLIIWADEDGDQQGIHANFKLSRGGEAIYLSNADESQIDGVVFGEQQTNVSLSRVPNGTGNFVAQHSTPLYSNDTPVSTRAVHEQLRFTTYPNPAVDEVTIQLPSGSGNYTLEIRSATGQLVAPVQQFTTPAARISVGDLPNGIYMLKISNDAGVSRTTRLLKQ